MAIREILRLGNPILFEKCEEIKDFHSTNTAETIQDLKDTLLNFKKENGFGRGIAAPQIGILKRIIYIDYQTEKLSGPLINPQIVRQSKERIQLWDDCFSFPDLMVKVERFKEIGVEFFNSSEEKTFINAKDALSELLQHEIDHLAGILSVQRAIGPKAFAFRQEWVKYLKK
ncbi:MAG: peptide deformylase [Proteobacteria bacterium]|nr:peptide deformylase [Pseudomonadota bacterium]